MTKKGLRHAEEVLDQYLVDTKAAYEWLSTNRSKADVEAGPGPERDAERARKAVHTIGERTFSFVGPDDVVRGVCREVSGVDGSSFCHWFDGCRGEDAKLVYGELSCFCVGCFEGDLSVCTGDEDTTKYFEVTMRVIKGRGVAEQAKVSKLRVDRAKALLKDAVADDWVLVSINALYGERELHRGARVAPVQLVDPKLFVGGNVAGGATRRQLLKIRWAPVPAWPYDKDAEDECVLREPGFQRSYVMASSKVCQKQRGNRPGPCSESCPHLHHDVVPLEKVVSKPFQWSPGEPPAVRERQARRLTARHSSAAASSSSSTSPPADNVQYTLLPAIVQEAYALIAADSRRFPPDALL